MNDTIYLLLGGNTGNRQHYLDAATSEIKTRCGRITAISKYYETAAWGLEDMPPFLNQALAIRTALTPIALLAEINVIEQELGRERIEKWGARTIDIDIIFYGDQIIDTPTLTIPHPLLQERRFVLAPLHEIAPQWMHPVFKKTVSVLLAECKDPLPVTAVA